jgi:hypothetical protein
MPILPVETQTDAVVQDSTTGAVDYLKYEGGNLVGSELFNYGIGPSWKIVADGNFGANPAAPATLVAQNSTTGQLDFLNLSSTGSLVSSDMTAFGVPTVHGQGFFGSVMGQSGPSLISQLPNGQLDMLTFGSSENLIATDLVAGTVGLPTVVGAGTPGMNNVFGATGTTTFAQLANGELDALGFSGTTNGGDMALSNTMLLPSTIGISPVSVVNPDISSGGINEDVAGSGALGVQLLSQPAAGTGDVLYLDSGFGTPATEGNLYATQLLSPLGSNMNFVDGSFVAQHIFPVS